MSDTYQPIYDAVRSRVSACDVGSAVERVFREVGIFGLLQSALEPLREAGGGMSDPSVLYRPKLSLDGDMWCALYGENLQDGVTGFGKSPQEAIEAFNRAWFTKIPEALR